jgi:hypothetical protein
MPGGAIKDFAKATLAAGIAAGATSLTVGSGEGGKFPAVFNFLVVIWNATDFPTAPEDDPAVEVLTVTNRVGDVFTHSAAANAHNTGGKTYKIILAPVAQIFQGAANQLFGADSLGTKTEHKTLTESGPVKITHSTGIVTLDALTPTEDLRGVHLISPVDQDLTQIMLRRADWITMDNGRRFTPTARLTFDKDVVGAGGMESTAVLNTWNRLFYIRKDDGTEALFGRIAKDYFLDVSHTTDNTQAAMRDDAARTKLAQGIQVATSKPLELVELKLSRTGTIPANAKVWCELWSDSGGDPSALLAASQKMDATRYPTGADFWGFVFRNPATPALSTQYHLVLDADYAISATNHLRWQGNTASGYANGVLKQFSGSAWSAHATVLDAVFKAYVTREDTTPTLPSGYTRSAQIGLFYIDGSGNIYPFVGMDRACFFLKKLTDTDTNTAYMKLHDWSTLLPPGAIQALVRGSHSVSGSSLHLSGFPRGFGVAITGDLTEGIVRGISHAASTTEALHEYPPIPTEFQRGHMALTGAGTGTVFMTGFIW